MAETQPVAVIACGAPEALRREEDPDYALIPEWMNGLPCEGGFVPWIGCHDCAFYKIADGAFDPHWGEVEVFSDFEERI